MQDTFARDPFFDAHGMQETHTRSFDRDDPLFENLVRIIVMQCLQFVEQQGESIRKFFAGMGTDIPAALHSGEYPPSGGALMVRDGLDRYTAQAVIRALMRRGAAGDDRLEEGGTINLFLYRMLDNAPVDM